MDDLFKNLALGFFGLTVLHGGLEERMQHDATRQVREAFQQTGRVRTVAHPRGLFGAYVNDLWAVDIYGDHLRCERLPFYIYRRGGWKGSIRHLRLHLTDFTLAGLTVERFEADVPFVKYDLGHAFYKGRLVFRGAERGEAKVEISAGNLRSFLMNKFKTILSDVEVWVQNRKPYLSGRIRLLGSIFPFTATGTLIVREGRTLELTDALVRLNGSVVDKATTEGILKLVNPVLDLRNDLKMDSFLSLTAVEIGERLLTVRGRVTIPDANEAVTPAKKETDGRNDFETDTALCGTP